MNVHLQVLHLCLIKIIALCAYERHCTFVERYTYADQYIQTFRRWQPNHDRWFWQEHGHFVIDSRYATRTALGSRIARQCCIGYSGIYPSCIPNCSTKCVNGECIAPEVCSCLSGYSKFSKYECKPSCFPSCGKNGECTAPNECTCFEGFRKNGQRNCEPICDNGCAFGTCIAPNTCDCDPGYDMTSTETVCEPICPGGCGANGKCTSPDVCTCFEGFKLEGQNYCAPICESGCPFGKCVAPNKCLCDPGYVMNSSGTDCEPFCLDGCGENGECTAPDKCTCFEGFKLEGPNRCVPICESGCPFGKCVAPNKCLCDPGYVMNSSGTDCEPFCLDDCGDNGECTAPDKCTCIEGFKLEGQNYCAPICESGCPFGKCVAPNKCLCDPGYVMNSSGTDCEPFCLDGCGENGECTAPDKCTCFEGFKLEGHNRCVPICDSGCPFGKCVAPNTCHCDPGYDMSSSETDCQPICTGGCGEYGKCTSPGVCTCFDGFSIEGHNRCTPICDGGCPFGKCIAPNTCVCQPDYVHNPSTNKCEPICSQGCDHGFCFRPGICVCDHGYLMGPEDKCEPVCADDCVNGICSEPDTCVCLPGHKMTLNSMSSCEPICETGCQFSNCAAPGVCLCWSGYIPINETACKPNCREECVNGYCGEPNKCTCYDGYEPHLSEANVCTPICHDCNNGDCIAPHRCHCLPGYEIRQDGFGCSATSSTTTESNLMESSSLVLEDIIPVRSLGTTIEENFTTMSALETTSTESMTIQSMVFKTTPKLNPEYEANYSTAKPSFIFSAVELFHCNCWVVSFATVNASSPGTCTPDCNSTNEIDCIDPQTCQADGGSMELSCNSTLYVCRAVAASSSKVVSTSGWLFWALVAGALLLACIIGIGLIVRKYGCRGSAVLTSKTNPEYAVQYVQRRSQEVSF